MDPSPFARITFASVVRAEGCESSSGDDVKGVANSRKQANGDEGDGGDMAAPATAKKKPVKGAKYESKFPTPGDIEDQVLCGSG